MRKYAVIGLGYVGLRTAIGLSRHSQWVVGYDINKQRIEELERNFDCNLDFTEEQLKGNTIQLTSSIDLLAQADFYIVDIGTPINMFYVPDMSTLKQVSHKVGSLLKKGDIVCYESTVYPGATEELFIPILEKVSGLKSGSDFLVGYSPERIVPGDSDHDITNTPKIISGQNEEALKLIQEAYSHIVDAKLVPVSSMKAAEAVKILENIQRDVNIALMNEYAGVMECLDINMSEVLAAASTKWNFLPFKPGFVGGHCISVDPYYLIYKARALRVDTDLMTTARKVNENFVNFIADVILHKIIMAHPEVQPIQIALLGLSYKKNVSDIRNSLSFNLYEKLTRMGLEVVCYDPVALLRHLEHPIRCADWQTIDKQQAIVIAVDHDVYKHLGLDEIASKLLPGGVLLDIPGLFYGQKPTRTDIVYWSL